MQNSFRWYGPNDPVSLSDIRQSNAEYLVTSLHQIPYGEKWTKNDVKKRIDFINKHNSSKNVNLKWNVVESIPVHNNIKLRHKNYKKLIDNYKDTIANIAKNKIDIFWRLKYPDLTSEYPLKFLRIRCGAVYGADDAAEGCITDFGIASGA